VAARSANPSRLAVRPLWTGSDQVITLRQHTGAVPVIFAQPNGGEGLFERTDYPCVFGMPACAQPGLVYLETNANLNTQGLGATTLFVQSNAGLQGFTFASGTAQGSIIASLEWFKADLGLTAEQCPENPDRIVLRSNLLNDLAFVQVQQVGGAPPIVAAAPVGGSLSYSVMSFGESGVPGDTNCDRIVDVFDLLGVIQAWGACVQNQPSCPADLNGDGTINVADLLFVIVTWDPRAR